MIGNKVSITGDGHDDTNIKPSASTKSHQLDEAVSSGEIKTISAALACIPPIDRALWLRIGMAIKSALGEAGFELWIQWSQQAESYIAVDAQATWRSIKPAGGITIATLYHEAQKRGFQFKGEHRPWVTSPEQQKVRQREIEQVEADDLVRKTQARESAERIWSDAALELGNHKYLQDKRVHAHGIRTDGKRLIVPMRDTAGVLHSLQFIDPNGHKRFHEGGRVSSCFYAIGKPANVVCLAEGYATAASIYEATGYAVAVAFTAGNLKPAAQALRVKYSEVRLIICADNDRWTGGNPGIKGHRSGDSSRRRCSDSTIPRLRWEANRFQ